ncbi:MAG: hypothetical protein HQL46_01640 [Gammaproteobacteria bacterium]|nr:hypothetical protein [Gammaproteobacteria bacterium]
MNYLSKFRLIKYILGFNIILMLVLLSSCSTDKVEPIIEKPKPDIIKKRPVKRKTFKEKLIGKWTGINNHGKNVFFQFMKNNRVIMYQGNKLIGGKDDYRTVNWAVDSGKNPVHLDVIINNEGHISRFRMIARFLNYNKIQIRMGKNLYSRPTEFSDLGTTWLQVNLDRRY